MTSLNILPVELLENVFSHLPLTELLASHTRVCRQWRDIICRKEFLANRKLYFMYRLRKKDAGFKSCQVSHGDTLLFAHEIAHGEIKCFIPKTLHRVSDWEAKTPNVNPETFSHIKFHSRFSFIKDLIQERFKDYVDSSAVHVCLIALVARDVFEIREIIKVLISPTSPATTLQVTELLYFIASLLLVGEEVLKIPLRLHYLVMYGLYLQSNSFNFDPTYFVPENASTPREQQSTLSLTAEQKKIVHFDLPSLVTSAGVLRIMAYAGTGKTTTLVELCKRNPGIKFLLVVFNRSVKDHSDLMFPKNVVVKTAHQLSWLYTMKNYGRERIQGYELKYTDLTDYQLLEKKGFKGFSHYSRAAMVIQTLKNFYNSSDQEIMLEHCPRYWTKGVQGELPVNEENRNNRNILREDAQRVWDTILEGRKMKVKFSHDSGMKAFQLSRPSLHQWAGQFDILLLDEAQDMNPAMMDICLSQPSPKIIVGDPHQQIYSFRGAVDALKAVEGHAACQDKPIHTLYLTQSFRFGPEIAYMANTCLKLLKSVDYPPLVGGKFEDTITKIPPTSGKIAIIGRTNVRLFEEMVQLVCEVEQADRPQIAFTVQTEDGDPLRLDELVQLEYFRSGQLEKMHERRRKYYKYNSWIQHVQQVKDGNDKEILGRIEIVEKYKEKIPEYVEILLNQSGNHFQASNVKYIFSTVHRFKGLESDTVRLLDDFIQFTVPTEHRPGQSLDEEYNLLYVALTRAKRQLILNNSLYFLLTASRQGAEYNFESIVPKSTVKESHCIRCGDDLVYEQVAGVFQKEVQVLRQSIRKGGALCCLCFRNDLRPANNVLSPEIRLRDNEVPRIQLVIVKSALNQFYSSILADLTNSQIQRTIQEVLGKTEYGRKEVEVLTDSEWRQRTKIQEETLRKQVELEDDLCDQTELEDDLRDQTELEQFLEEDDDVFLQMIDEENERMTSSSDKMTSSVDKMILSSDKKTSLSKRMTSNINMTSSNDKMMSSKDRMTSSSDKMTTSNDKMTSSDDFTSQMADNEVDWFDELMSDADDVIFAELT